MQIIPDLWMYQWDSYNKEYLVKKIHLLLGSSSYLLILVFRNSKTFSFLVNIEK